MPELPDLTLYVDGLTARIVGVSLNAVRVRSAFLLRSFDPPLETVHGRKVVSVSRLGKRLVLQLAGDLFLVIHLMIAGRLHWKQPNEPLKQRSALAGFDFDSGTLVLTEAGTKRRASLYVVAGQAALQAHDRGGLEPLECSYAAFKDRIVSENRTLKRALTAPHLLSGIGNAYSDEILHAARLSPTALTSKLTAAEIRRLYHATTRTLTMWIDALRDQTGADLPRKVTAFRDGMAVHGRYGLPCPACQTTVQRIRYAQNEINYCPRCQTGSRLLADRSLSRLLRKDWPSTIDAWEEEHPTGNHK
jgi:formamidopyrimidine-DNA glycosylase